MGVYVLDRYEPKSLEEHINKDAIQTIESWYNNGHKKPLLLVGPTGAGKSTIVNLFSKKHNFTLYELTPSDSRDKESIEKEAGVVSKSRSIFSTKNLLFFDNVDVFFGNDKGGLDTIVKIASESTNPVIFAASDIYADKKLSKVRDISEIFVFKKTSYLTITNLLKKICISENIAFDDFAIKEIALECDGDLRSAILDLDFLRYYGIKKEFLEYIGKRERKHDVFKTVLGLFKSRNISDAVSIRDSSDLDYDMLFNWITENLHLFYTKKNLSDAYHYVSVGDLNRARIHVRQNWIFLRYFLVLGIIAPAIYSTKDNFNYKISFPTFISKMGKETSLYAKNKKTALILQELIHASKQRIVSDIEYYKTIFSDKDMFIELTKHINDDEKEFIIDYFGLPKKYKDLNWAQESIEDIKPIVIEKPVELKKTQRTLFSF